MSGANFVLLNQTLPSRARRGADLRALACAVALAVSATGCLENITRKATSATATATATPTATPTLSVASGAKAAKVIFKRNSGALVTGGSFEGSLPATGTTPGATGYKATILYNPDDTVLATSPTSAYWPKWLTSLEVGISGTTNTTATNARCATFAASAGEGTATCNYGVVGTNADCGAQAGYFRVSEWDCHQAPPTAGTGGPNDGVYLRATFDRASTSLGMSENILAVLEYQASGWRNIPTDVTECFPGSAFTPTNCVEMTWQAYLKSAMTTTPLSPFIMLVPPTFGNVDTTLHTSGSQIGTKQFVLPLAADTGIKVLQISRVGGPPIVSGSTTETAFNAACNKAGGAAANSPLCMGMVFRSITFYRM